MAQNRDGKQRSYRAGGVPYGEKSTQGPAAVGDELPPGASRDVSGDPSPDGRQGPPDLGRGWIAQDGAAGFTGDPNKKGAVPPVDVSMAPSAPSVGIAAEPGAASEPPAAGDPETFRGEAAYNQAVREPYGGYQGGYPGEAVPEGTPDKRRFAPAYLAWRAEQIKQLDDDYEAWCRRRHEGFTAEFEAWQRRRAAARRRGRSGSDPLS